MNADKVLKIFLLPIIIFLWGVGWTFYSIGGFLQYRTKKAYRKFLLEIKEGEETKEGDWIKYIIVGNVINPKK